MKHITISCGAFMLLLTGQGYAQAPQKLNIDQATVFISGAELLSTAKVSLVKGENEILFSNVAGDVNNQSIVVNATNGAVVESVTFQNNYLATDNISPKAREIKDSVDLVTNQREQVSNKIMAITEQITVLQTNRKVGGDKTGLSVVELQKMLDLVGNKEEAYLNQRTKEQNTLKKIDEHLAHLNLQLDEEQKRSYQPGGQLLVKFYAKEATASNIAITYVVPNAGWSPTYDISAADIHSPVTLFYKANIYQNSGVKWNNVHLTLSTGNPQEGMQAPELNPWYIAFQQPVYKPRMLAKSAEVGEDVFTTSSATAQWSAPLTNGYAAAPTSTSMNDYVAVDNAGVNTSFDIDLPYSVPSDGQQHLVAIKKYEVPATYQYFSIPKLDKDAFLQAQITNWEDLNLLPGTTNIFYEGTYVGQGNIDPQNVKDTMYISMGRDKKIVIKKERDKSLRSVKTIGTNVREEFAYNITVRNTRKEAITIMLQDQQPVSTDKDIVIEDKQTGGADYDETTGLMKWKITLAPNETKKLNFSYTVKYPKGKTLANMR